MIKRLLLPCLIAITLAIFPIAEYASSSDLSPAVSEVSQKFAKKFCTSIENGMTPEKAGETAAAQLSKGLLFSPVMKEIMSAPKDDLAVSLSKNIFDGCGNDLGGTQEELDDYLVKLANKVPTKSTNSFQLPPTRQKPSK